MGDSALSKRAIECFEVADMPYWTLTIDQQSSSTETVELL